MISMSIEIELKLRIATQDVDAFKKHQLFQDVIPNIIHLQATYFDTPTQTLKQSKVALRIREENGGLIQTIKTAGQSSGGLHQRREWEFEVAYNLPDLTQLPSEVKDLFQNQILEPVFNTDFKRTLWLIEGEENSLIEVCLDEGEISCGHLKEPICEIELELKRGDIVSIYEIASKLQTAISLTPENKSKAARGYQLYNAWQSTR
jgi:triphosphatase